MQVGRPLRRDPAFRALWGAQTASGLGSQVSLLALPLLALTRLHGGALDVGLLRALGSLPVLLLGLPAGAWIERRPLRPVLLGCDLVRLLALAAVPVAYAAGGLDMALLLAVALVAGCATVAFDVAWLSLTPALVGAERLGDANALLGLSQSVSEVGGPGVAGLLIRAVGAAPAVAVDAASFGVSLLLVSRIPAARAPAPAAPASSQGTIAAAVEGLRWVATQPLHRRLAVATATGNFGLGVLDTAVLVLLARSLHLGAGAIGVVLAVGSTGILAGSAAAGTGRRRLGYGPAALAGLAVAVVGAAVTPLAPGHAAGAVVVAAGQWLLAAGLITFDVAQLTARQATCPPELRSRMTATFRWGSGLAVSTGYLLGGVLAAGVGTRPALWVGVGALAVAFLAAAGGPLRRLRELPDPPVAA